MPPLGRLWSRYETYLMIGPDDPSGDRLRARAVYAVGWSLVVTQLVHLASILSVMPLVSVEAATCVVVLLAAVASVASLRWWRNFTAYAVGVGVLSVGAPLVTAVYDYTGINTALLPMMVAGPVVVGFVGGPRLAAATGLAGLGVIAILYYVSAHAPGPEPAAYAERNLFRALQGATGVFFATTTTAVASGNTFRIMRQLEENAAKAQKAEVAKAEFLATMSHELRTPMNGVLGLADVLARADLNPDDKEMVETIRRSGRALMRILNDVLDLAKIDAGKLDLDDAPFSPRELVRDLIGQWKDAAAAKGVRLHAEVAAATPDYLSGDPLRLWQILSNLVSNAVKFTPAGFVAIAVDCRPDDYGRFLLRVQVRDTGPGVAPAARARIFGAFEQADQSVARVHGGTGLGLAISRRLAGLMGGALTLAEASDDATTGATFVFEAPFRPAQAPAPEAEAATLGVTLDVLVVDDNAVNRLVAGKLLGLLGHRAELADGGAACLAAMSVRRFDVILMDKHMPGMSGLETLNAIRRRGGAMASLPVIACTADAIAGERESLLAAGFDEFVAKPLSAASLGAALAAAVKAARSCPKVAASA